MKKISDELFLEICKYFFLDDMSMEFAIRTEEKIKKMLKEKFSAMEKHSLYTKYKTAESEEEKEEARKKYLDKTGIHKNFRW